MSGYRTIHRERVLQDDDNKKDAIWTVHATSIQGSTDCWRIWTGASDGIVRVYTVTEKQSHDDTLLDASALSFSCTHELLSSSGSTETTTTTSSTLFGCTHITTVRNYVGQDETAGDLIVATMNLGGTIRLWSFAKEWEEKRYDDNEDHQVKSINCLHECTVTNATGTTALLAPPRIIQSKEVVVMAVGCLDGTVVLVSTEIATPVAKKETPPPAGTILFTWGSPGSSIPLCLAWNPLETESLVIGRQNGTIDIMRANKKNHRLTPLASAPVRAVALTPDANLLVAGNDAGMLCLWDLRRSSAPVLVHHIAQAHASWIVNLQCLHDSRRFVSVGTDRKLHVWNIGQISTALHTLHLDSTTWTVHHKKGESRMVAGSENGSIFVFSLEA